MCSDQLDGTSQRKIVVLERWISSSNQGDLAEIKKCKKMDAPSTKALTVSELYI